MSECKHNWVLTTRGTVYFECAICYDRWNAERLVNALQNKVEQQANSIKGMEVRENYSTNCAIELSKKVGQLEQLNNNIVAAKDALYDTLKLQFNDAVNKNSELLEKVEQLESQVKLFIKDIDEQRQVVDSCLTSKKDLVMKNCELESQVAVISKTLLEIRNNSKLWRIAKISGCDQYQGLPPFCRLIDSVVNLEQRKSVQKMQELEKFAELGRLVIAIIDSGFTEVCLSSNVMDLGCEDCGWLSFCRKRAELLNK